MFDVILYTQWKWSRLIIVLGSLAGFALPIVSVQGAASGDRGALAAGALLQTVQSWGVLYPVLAAALGLLVAIATWAPDHRGRHVHALSLPVALWRYVLLRIDGQPGAGRRLAAPGRGMRGVDPTVSGACYETLAAPALRRRGPVALGARRSPIASPRGQPGSRVAPGKRPGGHGRQPRPRAGGRRYGHDQRRRAADRHKPVPGAPAGSRVPRLAGHRQPVRHRGPAARAAPLPHRAVRPRHHQSETDAAWRDPSPLGPGRHVARHDPGDERADRPARRGVAQLAGRAGGSDRSPRAGPRGGVCAARDGSLAGGAELFPWGDERLPQRARPRRVARPAAAVVPEGRRATRLGRAVVRGILRLLRSWRAQADAAVVRSGQ